MIFWPICLIQTDTCDNMSYYTIICTFPLQPQRERRSILIRATTFAPHFHSAICSSLRTEDDAIPSSCQRFLRCDIGELHCSGNSERNLHFAVVFSDPAELRFADQTDALPSWESNAELWQSFILLISSLHWRLIRQPVSANTTHTAVIHTKPTITHL